MITMAKKMEYHLPTQRSYCAFLSDRRYETLTVGVGQDVYDAHNQSGHKVKRLADFKIYDLAKLYRRCRKYFSRRSSANVTRPLNLIGFGSGGAAARAAVAGARVLLKPTNEKRNYRWCYWRC